MTNTNDLIEPGTPLPWVYEPHNGYGGTDPDGEPLPLGYISKDEPRVPIFELQTPLEFAHFGQDARYIVHACNAYPKLQSELSTLRQQAEAMREALEKIADMRPIGPEGFRELDISTLPCQQIARSALQSYRSQNND